MSTTPHSAGAHLRSQLIGVSIVAILAWYQRSSQWLLSGAPLLMCLLIAAGHDRAYKSIPLWALIASINLAYSVVAPAWILYCAFALVCWPLAAVSCLYQFSWASGFARRHLRRLLLRLQFTADLIAYFDLPALEIDQDVDGLMVIRGITVSLSSLTVTIHGVEVGIKLSDDLELALATDEVVINFFRRIHVDHIYGNIKGGDREMNFYSAKACGEKPESTISQKSSMLSAARNNLDFAEDEANLQQERDVGSGPRCQSPPKALQSMSSVNLDNGDGAQKYARTIQEIHGSSVLAKSRRKVKEKMRTMDTNLKSGDERGLRAAICTELHRFPTILHPPANSIRVTTLKYLSPPPIRKFLHRLPLLLRILLNALSYFHPVNFQSVTVGGSGRWVAVVLDSELFKGYAETSSDIRNLRKRMAAWLSDANFCLQIVGIRGGAQVPINTEYDINCHLNFDDILLFRTLPNEAKLHQVVRLGGADATVALPSFLLPHHEHLLPPSPTHSIEAETAQGIESADGKPQMVQARKELERVEQDSCNVVISSHVRLPVCFHPELLEFVAALVKATKIVEIERETDSEDEETGPLFKDMTRSIKTDIKHGLHKATINAVVNDRFIARLVYKIMRKLETAHGDVGYSGDLPVPLKPYRDAAEPYAKLLA